MYVGFVLAIQPTCFILQGVSITPNNEVNRKAWHLVPKRASLHLKYTADPIHSTLKPLDIHLLTARVEQTEEPPLGPGDPVHVRLAHGKQHIILTTTI